MTERACFLLHVRPQRLEEYRQAHEAVWPEMLAALSRSGWRNYSLFLRGEDGLMQPFFTPSPAPELAGAGRPLERLAEYFHLA